MCLKLEQTRETELYDIFRSEYNFEPLDPEWTAALEWEVPETDCPEGVDPLVRSI